MDACKKKDIIRCYPKNQFLTIKPPPTTYFNFLEKETDLQNPCRKQQKQQTTLRGSFDEKYSLQKGYSIAGLLL